MKQTHDLYTTLLGLRSQIEKAEEPFEAVQQDYESLYSNLETNTDSPAGIYENNRISFYDNIDKLKDILFEPAHRLINTIQPVLAHDIYDRCERLRDIFSIFSTHIMHQAQNSKQKVFFPNGLTQKEHVRIFLMGEFSTGKTTSLQRFLNQKAGGTDPGPTTALLVIHKVANDEFLEINCNDKFVISNYNFLSFLQKWELDTDFSQIGTTWTSNNPNTTIMLDPRFSAAEIAQFTKEVNDYPEAFKELIWTHRKRIDTNPVFEFADLYDMPGIGSSNEQHLQSISYSLQKHDPDIIFFLVDSGASIPSPMGTKLLRHILDSINNYEKKPLFFWVYETPTGNEKNEWKISLDATGQIVINDSFLAGNKDEPENLGIKKYLIDYIEQPHTNEDNFEFSQEQKDYLNESYILDIRGPKNQVSETVTNAIALAMQRYFCNRSSDFISYLNSILNMNGIKDNKPNLKSNGFDNNFLKEIVEEIITISKNNPTISFEDAQKIFFNKIGIQEKLPVNTATEIQNINIRLVNIVKDYLYRFLPYGGFTFSHNLDITKLLSSWESYWEPYAEEFFNLYKNLSGNYGQEILHINDVRKTIPILNLGSAIISIAKKDLKKLNDINSKVPICVPLIG